MACNPVKGYCEDISENPQYTFCDLYDDSFGDCQYWSPAVAVDPSATMEACGSYSTTVTCPTQYPQWFCCISTQSDWDILPTFAQCAADPLCDESVPANYRHCGSDAEPDADESYAL